MTLRTLASLAAGLLALCAGQPAFAYYIGPSYLSIPGIAGGAVHAPYRGWIRAEGNYWLKRPVPREIRGISGKESGLKFTGPRTPAKGPAHLMLAIDKASPALTGLMAACRAGAALPEVTYAESAEMARHPQEHGPRPADVPAYYEYKLRNVRLTCPVVADAPEQALGLQFDEIVWLNYQPQPAPRMLTAQPARLAPAARGGSSRTFIVSWFAPIADSANPAGQCERMNVKPTQAEYYALLSPERAAQQRAALEKSGGAGPFVMPYRGPDETDVTKLPGLVADPGFVSPRAEIVRGFDLDGHDGTGAFPAHTRAHANFTAPDGRKGVDNQLFTIQGCIAGWRRNGFLPMIGNELRRAGGLSMLVQIDGIDDPRNDDEVSVTILYSADPMKRDGSSKLVLSDYTFRVNDNPEFSQDFARFKGRMVDGVVMTDSLPKVTMHEGPASTWNMYLARMRLEFTADGELRATLGGYRDWREFLAMAFFQSSNYENTIGFNSPGMYNATRRAADGLKDPETGEYAGISAAYEMEGIPAFIPPEQHRSLMAGGAFRAATRR